MSIPLALLTFVVTAITILAFSFTVRGLLGVRFTLGRLVIAGIVAYSLAGPITFALLGEEPYEDGPFPSVWFSIFGTLVGVLGGTFFLVLAEILVPSNILPGPIYAWRAIQRSRKRAARYFQITRTIFRHGLFAYLRGGRRSELRTVEGREALAASLRDALNEGGVTFVKLGQILSTRRDLLPPEFIEELSHLQTRATPVLWSAIEPVLREEFDDLDTTFSRVDPEPLAAASIAQIHTGQLADGSEVVIKIRRPDVTDRVERDLDIVERLAHMIEDNTGWGRNIGAVDLAHGFAIALREELDFRVEARNLAVVATSEANDTSATRLSIPTVYPELSLSLIHI